MANSNNIPSSHRFPHDLEFCGLWSTKIPRSKVARLKKKTLLTICSEQNILFRVWVTAVSLLRGQWLSSGDTRKFDMCDYWCLVLTRCAVQIHKTWNEKVVAEYMNGCYIHPRPFPPSAFALVISCWNNGFWNNRTGVRTQAQTLFRVTEQFIWWL